MMLSVQFIIGQLNLPITNIISFIRSAQDAKISLERLSQIHNKENEQKKDESYINDLPDDKTINISNLDFRYGEKSTKLILQNLNVKIPQGKVTAIVGASGSGKTTLIKLLLKFYPPLSGSINIGGIDLNNINPNTWRRQCGSVMQDGYIFSDSIVRNITESDSEGMIDKVKLAQAVKVANIEEFIESLPTGYNTAIGASGNNLSGGQKQRILIARAVYKNPDYLFFDEATSSLDANNEKVIMENLNEFFIGKTVIVVAHRLSTVKNADNIIVLDKGKIIEEGNHQTLTQARGMYYTLVKNQLELGD
jgi:ATP-binding cassette subfamily B protein